MRVGTPNREVAPSEGVGSTGDDVNTWFSMEKSALRKGFDWGGEVS